MKIKRTIITLPSFLGGTLMFVHKSPRQVGFTLLAAGTTLPGFTPLASPAPSGPTASLGDACNNSSFQGDINIPDGTVLNPGVNFQKVWALKNTGTCKRDEGYSLVYIGGSTPDL